MRAARAATVFLRVGVMACVLAGFDALVAPASAQPVAPDAARAVAQVGGAVFTVADVRQLIAFEQQRATSDGFLRTLTPDGQERLVRKALDQRLLALAARREKLEQRADVRFRIEQLTAEVLARAYLDAKTKELMPSREQARAYFDAHPAEFRTGARVRARHVLVNSREEADTARAEILAGRAFEDVAAARSVEPTTRRKGGELGWVQRGVMVKPFEDALFTLKVGEVSVPVRTSFGYHVIRVDEIDEGTLPEFDSVEADVKRLMVEQELERLQAELVREFKVTVDAGALAAATR
jgi:peptidyl-prolyl cis-trans isomerase C